MTPPLEKNSARHTPSKVLLGRLKSVKQKQTRAPRTTTAGLSRWQRQWKSCRQCMPCQKPPIGFLQLQSQ
eukprot:12905920-Prorocentrum_lima.AAC.1